MNGIIKSHEKLLSKKVKNQHVINRRTDILIKIELQGCLNHT